MASNGFAHASRKSLAMGPSVRNLLTHYQLDPSRITSTGPHQTLLKSDVLDYVRQNKLKPIEQGHGLGTQISGAPTKPETFTPKLDISGYQPKGISRYARDLLKL